MIWRDEAVETVEQTRRTALDRQPSEAIPLDRLAGRTLTEPIVAAEDVPAHDHATMDGYAFDATDDYPLAVREGEIFPETEPPSIEPGEAIEIATGAALPPEANAVLKREESTVEDGNITGTDIEPGTYTYECGSNVQEGEQLFDAGERTNFRSVIIKTREVTSNP
jgi:molybdopterin molybdotransferase